MSAKAWLVAAGLFGISAVCQIAVIVIRDIEQREEARIMERESVIMEIAANVCIEHDGLEAVVLRHDNVRLSKCFDGTEIVLEAPNG